MYSMYSQMTLTMKSNISLSVIKNYSIYYIHAHDTGVKILYNSSSLAVRKRRKWEILEVIPYFLQEWGRSR